jgi:uncharacterized SAM-binding protein YcdF (DUF218 family)
VPAVRTVAYVCYFLRPLIGIALVGAACVWLGPLALREAGEFLNVGQPPVHADGAIVLAGGWTGERMLKAGELLRNGYVPAVFVSGPASLYEASECDVAIPFMVRRGFDASKFYCVATYGDSTREEAKGMAAEVRRRGLRRVLLVTSDYHTRRAAYIYRRQEPKIEIHVVAAPTPLFSLERWYRTREGWKYIFYEWTKLLTTWVGI